MKCLHSWHTAGVRINLLEYKEVWGGPVSSGIDLLTHVVQKQPVVLQAISDKLSATLVLCWPTPLAVTLQHPEGEHLVSCARKHTLQWGDIRDHMDHTKPLAHARCADGLEARPRTELCEIPCVKVREMSSTALLMVWRREERPRLFSLWMILNLGKALGTRIYFRRIVKLWADKIERYSLETVK